MTNGCGAFSYLRRKCGLAILQFRQQIIAGSIPIVVTRDVQPRLPHYMVPSYPFSHSPSSCTFTTPLMPNDHTFQNDKDNEKKNYSILIW